MSCFVGEYPLWLIPTHMHILSDMLDLISSSGTRASQRCWRHVAVGSTGPKRTQRRLSFSCFISTFVWRPSSALISSASVGEREGALIASIRLSALLHSPLLKSFTLKAWLKTLWVERSTDQTNEPEPYKGSHVRSSRAKPCRASELAKVLMMDTQLEQGLCTYSLTVPSRTCSWIQVLSFLSAN